MRPRSEIEAAIHGQIAELSYGERFMLELLLDIRELLTAQEDRMKALEEVFDSPSK